MYKGLGFILVAHVERYLMRQGVTQVYLLTTTAESFFERCGYASIDKKKVPLAIKQTREFSDLCPDSATLMMKKMDSEEDR